MRTLKTIATLFAATTLLFGGAASAQRPHHPDNMTDQPQAGTSMPPMGMTEQDVRKKLQNEGYTNVSNLKEGSDGVWMVRRCTAVRKSPSMSTSLTASTKSKKPK
jgi:hypothetical protein